eukprot:Phypoly_transcript_10622.p1 GENE.Phypoly_transcript_10622~~Phypoly_transcript_10622.p1  ORF type:complete len:306 (+),score=58.29 Phypoly_transcript_10622:35-919(+)
MAVVLKSVWNVYNGWLTRQPIKTKSITSGIMYGLGDVFAQVAVSYKDDTPLKLDWKRIGVITFFGTFMSGPLYHYWFAYLDVLPLRMLQMRKNKQKWEILRAYNTLKQFNIPVGEPILPKVKPFHKYTVKAAKILADQLIFSSLYTGFFFIAIGTMNGIAGVEKTHGPPKTEGEEIVDHQVEELAKQIPTSVEKEEVIKSLRAIRTEHNAAALDDLIQKLESGGEDGLQVMKHFKAAWEHTKEVYLLTYAVDWCAWPLLQLVNFSLVPLRYQVLYVNVCNLFWNTFLSFMANGH